MTIRKLHYPYQTKRYYINIWSLLLLLKLFTINDFSAFDPVNALPTFLKNVRGAYFNDITFMKNVTDYALTMLLCIELTMLLCIELNPTYVKFWANFIRSGEKNLGGQPC